MRHKRPHSTHLGGVGHWAMFEDETRLSLGELGLSWATELAESNA